MVSPCDKAKAGDTVGSLAEAHIKNTSCIDQYYQLLQSQKDWKTKQEAIYTKGKK